MWHIGIHKTCGRTHGQTAMKVEIMIQNSDVARFLWLTDFLRDLESASLQLNNWG